MPLPQTSETARKQRTLTVLINTKESRNEKRNQSYCFFLVIGTLASPLVLGKTTTKEVTFLQPMSVNGTLVKKGTYNVTFNDETGELTIKRGKKVVVSAQARLEKTSDREFSYTRSESDDPTKPPVLTSVLLGAGNRVTIVEKEDKTATSVRP